MIFPELDKITTKGNEVKKKKNLSVISEKDNVNLRAAMIHILGT